MSLELLDEMVQRYIRSFTFFPINHVLICVNMPHFLSLIPPSPRVHEVKKVRLERKGTRERLALVEEWAHLVLLERKVKKASLVYPDSWALAENLEQM